MDRRVADDDHVADHDRRRAVRDLANDSDRSVGAGLLDRIPRFAGSCLTIGRCVGDDE